MQSPIAFKVQAISKSGIDSNWESTAVDLSITTAIPPVFGGSSAGMSPEDLYALALANCYLATFKVIAAKSKLVFESINVEVELFVDKNENNQMVMKEANLMASLIGAENPERAMRLMDKTPENCMILKLR